MVYKQKVVAVALAVCLFACKNAANTEGSKSPNVVVDSAAMVTPLMDKTVQNFTVVPFQQVGNLTSAATSEADLKRIFGDSAVVRVNQGDVKTLVFPKTENELAIIWQKKFPFKKIETVIIRHGKWRTPEGIGIGSTRRELEAANGKTPTFVAIDRGEFRPLWNGGKVHPKLVVSYSSTDDRVFEMQINF